MLRRFRHLFERGRRRPGDAQAVARQRMIQRDLIDRGISSRRVLECMARVPRERFVDEPTRLQAYADQALPIACEQTISQPSM